MCQMCGSDDVIIDGDYAEMVCEKCKEEARNAAADWREDAGREEMEGVVL